MLSLVVYRPWVDRPFDTLDFSEFLPILRGTDGFWGRTAALSSYYAHEHGRLNLLSYVALAFKWTVLGPHPVLWQWARAVEFWILMVLCYASLRRLTLGTLAAAAGTSLFVIGRVAGEGWTRMTMGEPLGTLCALGALYLVTGRRSWRRPIAMAAAVGILLALAVLAKEMLIGIVPFVAWIGLGVRPEGGLGTPTFGRDDRRWAALVTLPALVAFGAAYLVATQAAAQGLSTMYGGPSMQVGRFFELLFRPWFLTGTRVAPAGLLVPGNTIFLVLLGFGLWDAARSGSGKVSLPSAIGAALLLSVTMAVLYLPWPYFSLYYAIPFLLGTALLFAVAVDGLIRTGPQGRWLALGGWLLVIGATAPVTARFARTAIAQQQVDGELVPLLARYPGADTILVARRTLAPLAWAGTGATLRRDALATGAASALPPALDVTCPEAFDRLRRGLGRTLLITYAHFCGELPGADTTIARRFGYIDVWWTDLSVATDSVVAQVLVADAPTPAPNTTDRR